jgi:hypothetical protein
MANGLDLLELIAHTGALKGSWRGILSGQVPFLHVDHSPASLWF